jgi:hypothetical protein
MSRRRAIKSAAASSYKSPNRGLALLDEAIDQISMQAVSPQGEWNQGEWRCESGMCLAGWVAQLGGGKWAFPADSSYSDLMVPDGDDSSDDIYDYSFMGNLVHCENRARRLLGLDAEEAEEDDKGNHGLFDGDNTLEDIRRKRDYLAVSVYV